MFSSLPTLALNSSNRIFYMVYKEYIEHTFHFLVEAVLRIINVHLSCGINL
jgi:hypothetical protein